MTDIEKRNELAVQIKELEAKLKPLRDEFRQLNKKINSEYMESLPYQFLRGHYSQTKKGITAVYWNYIDKTYYLKPLYKPSGVPYGTKYARNFVLLEIETLKEQGYVEKI